MIVAFRKPIPFIQCKGSRFVVGLNGNVSKISATKTSSFRIICYYDPTYETWIHPRETWISKPRYKTVYARLDNDDEATWLARELHGLRAGTQSFRTKLLLLADEVKDQDYK